MNSSSTDIEILKEVKSVHGLIQLRSDNILVFRPDVATFKNYSLDVLGDLHKEFVKITEGVPRPYLADNTYVTGIVNKKEQEFINDNFSDFATIAAIVTHSPIVNVLVNSYNAFFKPKVKIRLFNSESAAVKWLRDNG